MRKTINILWLDDVSNADSGGVGYLQDAFRESLKNQGYLPSYVTVSTIDEAKIKLADKSCKIDFFVSDYRLDRKQTGLSFLSEVRKSKHLKEHFVLYSNNSESTLRKDILSELNAKIELLDDLNNFSYFSTGNNSSKLALIKRFSEVIALALSRWEELSALKGEYASLNTLADWVARKILFNKTRDVNYCKHDLSFTYAQVIDNLESTIRSGNLLSNLSEERLNDIFDNWRKCKEIRNTLEHNTEKWDSTRLCYLICNPEKNIQIYESDMALKRKELINQMSSIIELFADLIALNDSLLALENDSDFITLKESF